MICPQCNTEARIVSSTNIFKDNKLFRRVEFACRNKNCPNFEKTIGEEDIEIPVVIE